MFFLLLLILPGVRTQDPTPQIYLRQHRLPFKTVQFLQHKDHLRKGPILFPNDAPAPPPTPLIVTSRPLSESIARSELNPNNSVTAQSEYHQVTFRPNYLARGNNYEPYSYTLTTVAPEYDFDPVKINEERQENFLKDYERLLEHMHPRKQRRHKRSADTNEPSERRNCNQRRLKEFITPRKPDSKAGEVMVQTLQQRMFDQNQKLPMVDEEKAKQNNKGSQHAPSSSRKALSNTKDYYYEFNEEDNNFDFDFKKLYTKGRKSMESNSSEYLEYYPDSKNTRRRQFARFANDEDFQIRPLNYLNRNSNGKAWLRLSEDEDNRRSDSAEESDEIADILGFSTTRHSVMKSVKHDGYVMKSKDKNSHYHKMDRRQRKTLANSGRRGKPQLRVVKPLHEFDNVQRQQNTAPKADRYKYKNSPDHYYHSKHKGGEHDYSQETNPSDNYAFSYKVKDHKTGDDFSHSQKSTGSATNGEYRVLLPDGRTQIVSYTADENGYRADVRYDERHNQENSIDFEYNKHKNLRNNDHHKVKQNYGHNQDHIGHEDILYRPQQSLAVYKENVPNYEPRHVENINDYREKNNNNFQHFNVYPTKPAFVGTTANINDRNLDGLSDNNNDYLDQYNAHLENRGNVERTKDDYKFSGEPDFSKEVVDYSSELDHAHEPYKSKFSSLFNSQNSQAHGQVRPSYNELKPLFVTNANGRRDAAIPVSTVRPVYTVTPADVVAITPKKPVHNLYTNIKNIVTPAPFIFSNPSPSTPRSYLLSTIANLKHQISLANKPVLSEQYINKINKYLSYSNPVKVTNK